MSTEIKEQTKPKMYVWAKTERAGDIVTVDKTEGEFTLFTDGTQIYTKIINDMLLEADNENQANNIAKPFKTAGIENNTEQVETKTKEVSTNKQSTEEVNIMVEMLKKVSAKNTITMPLEINVPSKKVYDLFVDQIEDDINEHILGLVMSQIDNLQEQLKTQAEEFIKNYYNGKGTKTNTRGKSKDSGSNTSAPDITY